MKRFIILIALAAMSCTASSQTLAPRVHLDGKDTLFCFNISQGKLIAKHLVNSKQSDSLLSLAEQEINQLRLSDLDKDTMLIVLKTKAENTQCIADNQQKRITELITEKKSSDKKLHWQLWEKRICAVAAIALGTALILKQ